MRTRYAQKPAVSWRTSDATTPISHPGRIAFAVSRPARLILERERQAKRPRSGRPRHRGRRSPSASVVPGCRLAIWTLLALSLLAVRWINPPFTAVHVEQRTVSQMRRGRAPGRTLCLRQARPDSARSAARGHCRRGCEVLPAPRPRLARCGPRWSTTWRKAAAVSASALAQQLMNLSFGTGRSYLRKGAELTLVPVAELVLGKRRMLELYLNVAEWGPGVYGAEATRGLSTRSRPEPRPGAGGAAGCDSSGPAETPAGADEQGAAR